MKITVKRKFCKRNRALTNVMTRKVMYLSYCSLMDCTIFVRRSEKGSIFRHKSFNVLFRRVKWQLVNLWSISFREQKIV